MWRRASSVPPVDRQRVGLAARRRLRRRRVRIAFGILALLLTVAFVWGLQQNPVRISRITVYGPPSLGGFGGTSAGTFAAYAREAMQGSYLGLIPRDSTFFFPAARIRTDILSAHLNIAAISFFREGLTGLSIKIHDRTPIARWCGASDGKSDFKSESSKSDFFSDANCYVFDASGYLYAAAATTETINNFALYAPLVGDTPEPLRATITQAQMLPSAFDFARQLDALGALVARVILRGDEADDILVSGTRITYVLGHEQTAFAALVSARENLNFADGSIDYIDLRFDGKVYLKKK